MAKLVYVDKWPSQPGQWTILYHEGQPRTVVLCCPKCGRSAHLEHEENEARAFSLSKHTITFHLESLDDRMFTASPSVVCPFEGCGWHVMIARSEYTEP